MGEVGTILSRHIFSVNVDIAPQKKVRTQVAWQRERQNRELTRNSAGRSGVYSRQHSNTNQQSW